MINVTLPVDQGMNRKSAGYHKLLGPLISKLKKKDHICHGKVGSLVTCNLSPVYIRIP